MNFNKHEDAVLAAKRNIPNTGTTRNFPIQAAVARNTWINFHDANVWAKWYTEILLERLVDKSEGDSSKNLSSSEYALGLSIFSGTRYDGQGSMIEPG